MDAFDFSTIIVIGNIVSMVGLLVLVPRMIERAMSRRTTRVYVSDSTSDAISDAYSEGYEQAMKDMRDNVPRAPLPIVTIHKG